MAKASVKQRAPAKRPAAAAKSPAKPAARAKASPRKPVPVAKRPASKSVPAKKVAVAKLARAVKAIPSKSAVLTKASAKPVPTLKPAAKPAAKTSTPGKASIPAKASNPAKSPVLAKAAIPAKASIAAKSLPPVVAKPAPAVVKAAPAPAPAKPASTSKPGGKGAKIAEPAVEAPKPTGRPMLSQGPFVSTALTKRGTFAPNKLLVPAPKPRRVDRPAPLSVPTSPILPPAPAVATGQKAQKNRAGFSPKDLEFFRDLLLARRRELLGDMSSMEREALREGGGDLSTLPIHMADQGTDAYEQEFTLGLVEKDRTLLRELNNALAKIQNGSYGICEGTGLPISRPRLEAQPWAKYSIEHARVLEKRQMMFRR